VVGFPQGCSRVEVKLRETEHAIADGATEIDVVVNIGKALSQDWFYVSEEIRQLNALTVKAGVILRVIFENDFLTKDADKNRLCEICSEHAVAFVKTSTGYGFVKRQNGMYRSHPRRCNGNGSDTH
jgi:deoxyribose-phosphate aldolase